MSILFWFAAFIGFIAMLSPHAALVVASCLGVPVLFMALADR
jgi:hypothetical protein